MKEIEIWKPVPGFGGHYEASSLGRIRTKERVIAKKDRHTGALMTQVYKGRILNCGKTDEVGHRYAHLGIGGKKITIAVHRLVLLAFVGDPADGQECCHNNGIAWDNRPENLRWGSHLENMADRKAHGHYLVGAEHVMAKLSESQVAQIRGSTLSNKELGELHGVGASHIWGIRARKSWSHI